MTRFTIDPHNNITAFGSAKEAKVAQKAERSSSEKERGRLAEKGRGSRLVKIGNTLPGKKPLKKFTSRKAAITRIWVAIQSLAPHGATQPPGVASKQAKPRKRSSRAGTRALTRTYAKTDPVRELLTRPDGVTLKE